MRVHAGAVVAEERLGHEAGGLAVLLGDVLDDVFVNHHPVGGGDERAETIVNFGLAGGGDFVVLLFDFDAQFFHRQHHFGADVLLGVGGCDREIAFLVPDFVAEVRHFVAAAVPDAFLAVNGVERAIALGVELDVVEDEEFGFRTEEGLVADAGGDEIFFRLLRDAARVAAVRLQRAGFGDGAGEAQRRNRAERINERRDGIGHGQHVGGFDALPAADGGAVETDAFGEGFLGQFADGHGEVLPGAKGVHELDVHHFRSGLFCQFNYALGCCHIS